MDTALRVKENKGLARCFRDTVRKKIHLAIEDTRKGRIWIQSAYSGKKKGRKETKEPTELWG